MPNRTEQGGNPTLRDVTISRQEAEFGLLPPVCIVCGRSSAQTESVRLFAAGRSRSAQTGPLGLLRRRMGRSLVLLVPVCSDHRNMRSLRSQAGVQMARFSRESVTLSNVSEAFANEWAAGARRRVAPAGSLVIVEDVLAIDESEVLADDSVPEDFLQPLQPRRSPVAAGRSVQRSSLWVLTAMVSIVVPLVVVGGLLFLSALPPPRARAPRPAGLGPPPAPAQPPRVVFEPPVDQQHRIRGAQEFRRRRRIQQEFEKLQLEVDRNNQRKRNE